MLGSKPSQATVPSGPKGRWLELTLGALVGGFDSRPVHVLLTEEQEKELDEMAKRFAGTKGGK